MERKNLNELPGRMQEVIAHSRFICEYVLESDTCFFFYTESGYCFCTIEKNGAVHLEKGGKTVNFEL